VGRRGIRKGSEGNLPTLRGPKASADTHEKQKVLCQFPARWNRLSWVKLLRRRPGWVETPAGSKREREGLGVGNSPGPRRRLKGRGSLHLSEGWFFPWGAGIPFGRVFSSKRKKGWKARSCSHRGLEELGLVI